MPEFDFLRQLLPLLQMLRGGGFGDPRIQPPPSLGGILPGFGRTPANRVRALPGGPSIPLPQGPPASTLFAGRQQSPRPFAPGPGPANLPGGLDLPLFSRGF